MNPIKTIRARLGLTQQELAEVLEMSQGNVGFYERGLQAMPPAVATRFISYARAQGCLIGFEDIYGALPVYRCKKPPTKPTARIAQAATETVAQGVANA